MPEGAGNFTSLLSRVRTKSRGDGVSVVAAMSAVRCAAKTRRTKRDCFATNGSKKRETTMRKILMVALGVSLIAASSVQVAAATERHRARKVVRAPTSEQWRQFRGARNSTEWPNGSNLSRL